MSEDRLDEWVKVLRNEYNPPQETPREEMWAVVETRLGARGDGIASLGEARARRTESRHRLVGWAIAAAALVVLGIGIVRATVPDGPPGTDVAVTAGAGEVPGAGAPALRIAALRHLGRTESLIAMVRADARSGRVDPQIGSWATGLLRQTRLLLDRTERSDPALRALLEDLELVLVQVVGASELGGADEARASAEMSLTLECIEQREVLPRIQAFVPAGTVLAGA
jgi:hypothetical protein